MSVFLNPRAFERKTTNQFGKKGDKIFVAQIVVTRNGGQKDSVNLFREDFDTLYLAMKELNSALLQDEQKVIEDAWQKWQDHLATQK